MSSILGRARQLFEACETGKGWDACSAFCTPDATFSLQTTALAEISTLEEYCEWMKGLLTPIPDGHYADKKNKEDTASTLGHAKCAWRQDARLAPGTRCGRRLSYVG